MAEFKVPGVFFIQKSPAGKMLLHLAVEKGNVELVKSLLSQLEAISQNYGLTGETYFSTAINACDEQGNTSLKIAIEKSNEELILLLLKKGARGKEYLLSRESPDLPSIIQGTIDKGSHLKVDYLSPSHFFAFFERVAKSRSLLSLGLSAKCYRDLKKARLDFFQGLAGALQSNFQRDALLSPEDLQGNAESLRLLVLDLRDCEELTSQEIKPLSDV